MKELKKFEFGGQTRFKCPDCLFDHYDEMVVREHFRGVHATKKQNAPIAAPLLFDFNGEPVAPEAPKENPEIPGGDEYL